MAEQHDGIANHRGSRMKDEDCAGIVAILMELKYFDEQFVYYGTSYVENGVIKYRMHDKAEKIYRFYENSVQYHLYPLEIVRFVQYKKVPSGKENEIAVEVQADFAKHLKEIYPKQLFRMIQLAGATKASDAARPILKDWQDALELCFVEDKINLFAGAVQMVYQAKQLTDETFKQMINWVDDKHTQIISHTNSRWRKPCKMHGFLYQEYGKQQVYVNALWHKAVERQHEIKAKGLVCTPIFSKEYWMDSMPGWDLTKWRGKFEEDIKTLMDESYFEHLAQLWNLPSVVDNAQFQQQCECIDLEAYPAAKKVIDYYGAIWGCK